MNHELKKVKQKLISEKVNHNDLEKSDSELSGLIRKTFKGHSKAETAPLINKLTRVMKKLQSEAIQVGYKEGVMDSLTEVSDNFELFDLKSLEITEEEKLELDRLEKEAMEMDFSDFFDDELLEILEM